MESPGVFWCCGWIRFCFLAWHCSREEKLWLVIAGNAVSSVLTLALLSWAYFGGLWQFELFGPFGWTVFLLALTIPVQAFCWNRYWGMLAAYISIVVGGVGYQIGRAHV